MPRALPFNPAEYTKATAPVVDAFEYDNGDMKAQFTRAFLQRVCDRMNQRFEQTGDLSPIVIGHTIDGAPEHDQPQKVGVLHNWRVGEFAGRDAAYADHYIKNENTVVVQGAPLKLSAREVVERWPRRSGEIWFGKYEVDPHCLLGATTPCRDLGLLRLDANGQGVVAYQSPGELKMPLPNDPTAGPGAAPQDTGPFKNLEAQIAQLTAMVGQLLEVVTNGGPGAKPGDAKGAPDDASFDDFLKQLEAEGGAGGEGGEGEPEPKGEPKEPKAEPKGEPKEPKEPKGEPKPDEEKAKLQRERDEAVVKLARTELVAELTKLKDEYHVAIDPANADTIRDLLALPDDIRAKTIKLWRDGAPKLPGAGGNLNRALTDATDGKEPVKRIDSKEKQDEVIKFARKENLPYNQAAVKLGYTLDTK